MLPVVLGIIAHFMLVPLMISFMASRYCVKKNE